MHFYFLEKSLPFRIVSGFITAVFLSFLFFTGCCYFFIPTNITDILTNVDFNDNERIHILYFLSIETISIFLIPALILLFAIFLKPSKVLFTRDLNISQKITLFFIVIFVTTANIPGINLLSEINISGMLALFGENSEKWLQYQKLETFTEKLISKDLVWTNIFTMAFIPAICEEMFFRGFLQTTAIRALKNRHFAVFTTAAVFSILHGDIFNFIPRMLLGILLGYLFLYTQNIIYPIITHLLHNTWVILFNTTQYSKYFETIGTSENNILLGIISFLILVGFIIYLSKHSVKTIQTELES
ncbi:MAG: CPBP family intramembrane metalloprotease [Bacteroidales bacterium]|nr:CPBP family intramembrane metalloprotease [Bacteroidales bacterium]